MPRSAEATRSLGTGSTACARHSCRSRLASPATPPIERELKSGHIGWLEDDQPRGEAIDVLPGDLQRAVLGQHAGATAAPNSNVLYGRVLAPDPDRPARVVLTLN